MRSEPAELNDVVRGTVGLLARLLGESIEVELELAEGAGTVNVDRGQLGQIVMNLVLNARDAMPSGGRLRIRTAPPGPWAPEAGQGTGATGARRALLEVTDTGVGMDEAVLARAFEPFFTTKPPGTGTGLGLSTARGVVARAGGSMTVRSQPGRGAAFRILLPPAVAPPRTPSVPPASSLPSGTETILVVEDRPSLRQMMAGMLAMQGYRVLEASDPEAAIDKAASYDGPIDMLVTDVVMPRINGRELAERVTARRPGLRVLYVSGYPDDDLLRHGVERGTVELLVKPFKVEALAERVREVLDRKSAKD
jgi:CheY-like chemotaxis protein